MPLWVPHGPPNPQKSGAQLPKVIGASGPPAASPQRASHPRFPRGPREEVEAPAWGWKAWTGQPPWEHPHPWEVVTGLGCLRRLWATSPREPAPPASCLGRLFCRPRRRARETCSVTMGTDAPIYPAAGPCEGATAAVQPPGLVRGCGAVPHPSHCPSGLLSGWWPPSCVWVQ